MEETFISSALCIRTIFKHLNDVKVSAKKNPVLIQVKEVQQQFFNFGLYILHDFKHIHSISCIAKFFPPQKGQLQ